MVCAQGELISQRRSIGLAGIVFIVLIVTARIDPSSLVVDDAATFFRR